VAEARLLIDVINTLLAAAHDRSTSLTSRAREVLALMAEGRSNVAVVVTVRLSRITSRASSRGSRSSSRTPTIARCSPRSNASEADAVG
jgi:hypothetical protein